MANPNKAALRLAALKENRYNLSNCIIHLQCVRQLLLNALFKMHMKTGAEKEKTPLLIRN